ncbi:MAG: hypothetical protein ACRD1X_07900 [Vicinamibacteria bacterium]
MRRRTMSTVFRSRTGSLLAMLGGALIASSCATSGENTRVETFPAGEQTNILIGGLMSGLKDTNVVERVYQAPYEKVWAAVKRVAERFDKVGGRPLVAIDEKNGRVQNGNLTQDALIGLGGGAWADQFVTEATAVSPSQTRVAVARRVVQKESTTLAGGRRGVEGRWKSQWSNGQIESWLLTQIEDELKAP